MRRGGDPDLMLAFSRELEHQAEALGETAIVLAKFQDSSQVDDRTWRLYERLADRLAFVGMLGTGMEDFPARGVRGAHLASGNGADDEWDVAVLGPHFAAALAARQVGDREERSFDFAVTHDRDLAVDCARALMERIAPSRPQA